MLAAPVFYVCRHACVWNNAWDGNTPKMLLNLDGCGSSWLSSYEAIKKTVDCKYGIVDRSTDRPSRLWEAGQVFYLVEYVHVGTSVPEIVPTRRFFGCCYNFNNCLLRKHFSQSAKASMCTLKCHKTCTGIVPLDVFWRMKLELLSCWRFWCFLKYIALAWRPYTKLSEALEPCT